jgi:hypothetical protein
MRCKLLILFGVPLGLLALYVLWQCALPAHPFVDAAFAVPGKPDGGQAIPLEPVAARYLPRGMPRDEAMRLLRRAGFRMKPAQTHPGLAPECPVCEETFVGRYSESIFCGGEAIVVTIGFQDGWVRYLRAARVLREFYI